MGSHRSRHHPPLLLPHTYRYTGNPTSNLGLILYANVNLLLVGIRSLTLMVTSRSSPHARALVDRGHLMVDTVCAYLVLAAVGAASLIGVVAWAQTRLLFNVSFARSVRRGELIDTLGPSPSKVVPPQLCVSSTPDNGPGLGNRSCGRNSEKDN